MSGLTVEIFWKVVGPSRTSRARPSHFQRSSNGKTIGSIVLRCKPKRVWERKRVRFGVFARGGGKLEVLPMRAVYTPSWRWGGMRGSGWGLEWGAYGGDGVGVH
jgi:hypothetical protein